MRLVWLILLTLAACDPSTPVDDAGPSDTGVAMLDARPTDAGAPALDPAVFDCSAAGTPDRASTRPLHCALDVACTDRLVSAHRGAGAPGVFAPEDTLSAIRAAIALGVDMVEVDARPSSDDVLVLMHDETVDRTTEGTGAVSSLTLAELQALTVRSAEFAGDFSCEQIPTLADAIAVAAGRVTLIVEPKTDRPDLLVATLRDAGALAGVILDVPADDAETLLAMEPTLNFFIRPTSPPEVATLLTRFAATPPRYVHIAASSDAALIAAADDAGQRVFALAFAADIVAELRGTPQPYVDRWDEGVQMLQTNRPDLALAALAE